MNIWNAFQGLIAFLISIVLVIGFGQTFIDLLGIVETPAKIFIGTLIVITITTVGFFLPIEMLVSDDQGRVN